MKINSVLFIDIPETDELIGNPFDSILSFKWKVEDLITGPNYTKHMNGIKFTRGLLTIASYVRENGITPKYISINDVSQKELDAQILSSEAVGIPANVTAFFPQVCRIARRAKELNENILTFVGGNHATYQDTNALMQHPEIDVIVRGEGEIPSLNLLKKYPNLENVRGITYRDKGNRIRRNPDSIFLHEEKIPIPSYDLLPFPIEKYSIKMQTTRGCPYSCSFCIDSIFWKNVRPIPIPNIIEELTFLSEKLPEGTHIHFIDSIFTLNPERTEQLCKKIKINDFKYSADIRANFINKKLVKQMEEVGFTQLCIGFEDPNEEVLKIINKKLHFQDCIDTTRMIKENSNILTTAYWIIGLPGSTHKTLNRSIKIGQKLIRDDFLNTISSGVFVPTPGTPIFEQPSKFGLKILGKNWEQYMRCNFSPVYCLNDLTASELANYYYLFETSILKEYCKKSNLFFLKDDYKFTSY